MSQPTAPPNTLPVLYICLVHNRQKILLNPERHAFQPARFGSWYWNRGSATTRLGTEDGIIYGDRMFFPWFISPRSINMGRLAPKSFNARYVTGVFHVWRMYAMGPRKSSPQIFSPRMLRTYLKYKRSLAVDTGMFMLVLCSVGNVVLF
jgi:hypothetical protein